MLRQQRARDAVSEVSQGAFTPALFGVNIHCLDICETSTRMQVCNRQLNCGLAKPEGPGIQANPGCWPEHSL